MSEHTPTPWYADATMIVTERAVEDGGDIICEAPEGFAESFARWQANASFIVRACNSHNDLVKEVTHWKGLYEDEKRDHEATLKHLNEESEAPL